MCIFFHVSSSQCIFFTVVPVIFFVLANDFIHWPPTRRGLIHKKNSWSQFFFFFKTKSKAWELHKWPYWTKLRKNRKILRRYLFSPIHIHKLVYATRLPKKREMYRSKKYKVTYSEKNTRIEPSRFSNLKLIKPCFLTFSLKLIKIIF